MSFQMLDRPRRFRQDGGIARRPSRGQAASGGTLPPGCFVAGEVSKPRSRADYGEVRLPDALALGLGLQGASQDAFPMRRFRNASAPTASPFDRRASPYVSIVNWGSARRCRALRIERLTVPPKSCRALKAPLPDDRIIAHNFFRLQAFSAYFSVGINIFPIRRPRDTRARLHRRPCRTAFLNRFDPGSPTAVMRTPLPSFRRNRVPDRDLRTVSAFPATSKAQTCSRLKPPAPHVGPAVLEPSRFPPIARFLSGF
jgi:hypothetical protein